MINYTNITDFANLSNPLAADICKTATGAYTPECLIKNFCPQINHYFINMGALIVAVCIFMTWFTWWFFEYGYKKIDWDASAKDSPGIYNFIGDLRHLENRQYWDSWIRDKLLKWCIGFIVVMIYLYLRIPL